MTRLSVIIPTYKRGQLLIQCLESVAKSISSEDEIIVVNDFPKVPITPQLENKALKITLLNNPKQGVASARNLGAKYAKGKYLLFIDDDIEIKEDTISMLFYTIHSIDFDSSCYNSNWIYPPELHKSLENKQFGRFLIHYDFVSMKGWSQNPNWDETKLFQVPSLASHFLSITKENFEKIGGYDEDFPFAGFEDDDFSKRASQLLTIYCDPLNVVYHNESDRVQLNNWLQRKFRGSMTRKVAVNKGREDLAIHFSLLKTMSYSIIYASRNLIFEFMKLLPNKSSFDGIYFKCVNILLGAFIFRGYNQGG